MKSIVLRALGVAAVAACLTGSVYAQSSDAAATEAAASSPKAAAKTAKKANRKLGYAVRKAITKAGGVDVANLSSARRAARSRWRAPCPTRHRSTRRKRQRKAYTA